MTFSERMAQIERLLKHAKYTLLLKASANKVNNLCDTLIFAVAV